MQFNFKKGLDTSLPHADEFKLIYTFIYGRIYSINTKAEIKISKIQNLPNLTLISSATLAATDMAATRRGWVQPIFFPPSQNPASYRYCGTCVVFPLPVSPSIIKT